jgi:PAS domain S-box-containing protein
MVAPEADVTTNPHDTIAELRQKLDERTAELDAALEQQTASAEILAAINATPGNLTPVFQIILEKAVRLCGVAFGMLDTWDGEALHTAATYGLPPAFAAYRTEKKVRRWLPPIVRRLVDTRRTILIPDSMLGEGYVAGHPDPRALVDLGGARTTLLVPLVRDDRFLGYVSLYRQEVRPFTERQITLLENFATQAVIAMENARLLSELRRSQEELRLTFENMGDGVAMFDDTPRLVAWNGKFQEILDLPNEILAERRTYADYIRFLAERGEYGRDTDPVTQLRRFQERIGEHYNFERMRPDGRVIEVRHNPVPHGGFVLIYADITERKRSEAEIRAARDSAESAYRDLKVAQASLIQAEKMASLGQLTAGIAHEIKNPLNFVNNFAGLSCELLSELKEAITPAFAVLGEDQSAVIEETTTTLTSNLEKIVEHGQRADGIVRGMLEHSRGVSGERRTIDLNTLVEEALNLAYHGARAQDRSLKLTLERDFARGIAPIELAPQDITRVLLNLINNGLYAASEHSLSKFTLGFEATLKVTTRDLGDAVEIRVRDNGTGVQADIKDKLFQPFFTTKPTGKGTGLGLSIAYDIVTNQHGGTITVDSEVAAFTEFVVTLPRQMFSNNGSRE